jgi:uncharacterized protein
MNAVLRVASLRSGYGAGMMMRQQKARACMDRGAWAHLAVPGAEFAVRVTPNAARPGLSLAGGAIRAGVTVPPEDGRANAAVQILLARALGVAKTRLTLILSAKSRDKVFRLAA